MGGNAATGGDGVPDLKNEATELTKGTEESYVRDSFRGNGWPACRCLRPAIECGQGSRNASRRETQARLVFWDPWPHPPREARRRYRRCWSWRVFFVFSVGSVAPFLNPVSP